MLFSGVIRYWESASTRTAAVPLPELRIPLQMVSGDALQGWEDEMETELSTPFPVEDALLVRAVLLHEAHRATPSHGIASMALPSRTDCAPWASATSPSPPGSPWQNGFAERLI